MCVFLSEIVFSSAAFSCAILLPVSAPPHDWVYVNVNVRVHDVDKMFVFVKLWNTDR